MPARPLLPGGISAVYAAECGMEGASTYGKGFGPWWMYDSKPANGIVGVLQTMGITVSKCLIVGYAVILA